MEAFLFLSLPIGIFIWFIISLISFIRTPKEEQELRHQRKIQLIISSVMTFIFVGGFIFLLILLSLAIANM